MQNKRTDPASFRDYLEQQQIASSPRLRKGERTRARIRLAAVELLNEVGYRDMRVSDVCDRAGVTQPAIYLYFDSKLALTEDVLREFLQTFMAGGGSPAGGSPYDAIYGLNLRWIASARANAGLIQCLLQVSDENSEFGELLAAANERWYVRISQEIIGRFPRAADDELQIRLAAYTLGGMLDDLTRRLFSTKDERLRALVNGVAPNDEALAAFVSGLWYRALYGVEPPPQPNLPLMPRLHDAAKRGRRKIARIGAEAE